MTAHWEGLGAAVLQPDLPLADARKPTSSFPKQPIVVIHGMGEQVPMDTLRGFVRAVWETDSEITKNGLPNPAEVWSKPDLRSELMCSRSICWAATAAVRCTRRAVLERFFASTRRRF
jgi:hypothetical protein